MPDPPNPAFQLSADHNVISELWEGEFDFHYFSDHELFINEITSHVHLASAASKAQKAKFWFPSSDPQANQVIDND